MSNQKPVWREVDGGVPSGTKEAVYIFNGELLEGRIRRGLVLLQGSYHAGRTQGGFYNTNRTKAAKYEKVVCNKCHGQGYFTGFNMWVHDRVDLISCNLCNCKGYQLKAIK